MPVVPFTNRPSDRAPAAPIDLPAAQEPWALMAAAQMDAEGRLVAKPQPIEPPEVPNGS